VASSSVRIGGNKLDQAILEYARRSYNLAIGERTAEEIKINIGAALPMKEPLTMEVRGRDMITGLPRTISMNTNDVVEAVKIPLEGMIEAIKDVLHNTPPELAADVIDKGIIMSGGTSLLRNVDQLISKATGVPAYVADDALFCVAKGTGIALENLEAYKRSILIA
jgi:rod shape-determining protein MreB